MNAIEVKNLVKKYPGFTLDNISFSLPEGCIIGFIGENGAGKSTTIKLLLGISEKDSGSISVLGNEGCPKSLMNDIGIVMGPDGIPECLSAVQLGRIMSKIYSVWDDALYNNYLSRFSVPADKAFKDLSSGTKMKLLISIALSHKPRLLVLDEPTSGLDPLVRDEVIGIFSDFTRDEKHSILISSHITSDLEKICDYIAFLHKGKLLLCCEKDFLYEKYALCQCSAEEFRRLDPKCVLGFKASPYGVEAAVDRSAVPYGTKLSPINLEELFIYMTKER